MNKQIAIKLYEKVEQIAARFSNPERMNNNNKEVFNLDCIRPLSEFTAMARFNKSSGKRAIAFLYFINQGSGYWAYFFPKESHVYGMQKLPKLLEEIERFNLPKNKELIK